MALFKRKATILAKIESTYGTDPTPSGGANAVLVSDLTITPMDMNTVSRDLIRPYFGNSEDLPTQVFAKVEFSCEVAGSGTAGTAPAWGPLLRACAFAETITAGTKVEYKPVSDAIESVTLYANADGVLHKLTGARGTVSFELGNNKRPVMKFAFTGIFNAVADAAAPSVTLTGWKKPLPVTRANTPVFTVQGYAARMEDFTLDVANQVESRSLVGGTDEVLITDRKPAGKIQIEAVKVADKDWWTSILAVTTGALAFEHGVVAGNIVDFDLPAVQLIKPSYSDSQGVLMLSADLRVVPGASGNDEMVITAK